MPRARPWRQGRSPAGFVRGELDDVPEARVFAQKLPPELDGIPPCGVGELVQKAFRGEGILRRAYRAPMTDRNRNGRTAVVHEDVRNVVRHVGGAIRRARVHAPRAVSHGRGHDAQLPGGHATLRVKATLETVVGRRPVEILLHIFFARPNHLHRRPRPHPRYVT